MHQIKELLHQRLKGATHVVVLGVGSELRGDDAAGSLIAEKLSKKKLPNFTILTGGSAPENFTGEIRRAKPSHLVIIDTAEMGKPPGHIELIEKEKIGGYSFSTHSLPMNVMLDYLLHDIKYEVIILGIQPKSIAFGAPVCPEVLASIEEIVKRLESLS